MGKLKLGLLVGLFLLGFILRLYRFDFPVADWHSWRQADTSSVSRVFTEEGFNLIHPKYHDLSNVGSGIDNPMGHRFVEFPVYNLLQAGLFSVFDGVSLEEWGRLVSIFASLISALCLYILVSKRAGKAAGVFSSFFFLLIPFNIYYSRTILPDPSMVAASLLGITLFDKWIENVNDKKRLWILLLSCVFTALALLFKPYAIFFTFPIIYLAYSKFGIGFIKRWELWTYLILSITPLVLWRYWMLSYPEGIASNLWLFNEGSIRFKGAYFYWIFADRIGRLILGYWGVALLVLGFLSRIKKEDYIFFSTFILSSLAYLVVIARGNVQHDYYQILIVPSIAIFLGLGADYLLSHSRKYVGMALLVVITAFTIGFGWYFVRDFFNINNEAIVRAGREIDQLIPKDAKVIALYNGDTSFLYQTGRKGWTSLQHDLPEMIRIGADYLAIPNPTDADREIGNLYKIVSQSEDYILFNLREKP